MYSFTISSSEILVYGGYTEDGGWQKESFIFNFDIDSRSEAIDMPFAPDSILINTGAFRIGDTIYA